MTTLQERLRSLARWGTMTSEFDKEDRIEWMAADALDAKDREIEQLRERLAGAERANAELNVEVSRLYSCRNELQDVTRAMGDPSVNNARSLEDAIHAMKARLAEAERLLLEARETGEPCVLHEDTQVRIDAFLNRENTP